MQTDLLQVLLDPTALAQACRETDDRATTLKQIWENGCNYLDGQFSPEVEIGPLIELRAHYLDQFLSVIWASFDWQDEDIALIAVGGYGRGELHPHSDVDLLILLGESCTGSNANIEGFIALLWDIKLTIGHSVRTVADCVVTASADITVTTTMMESRLIAGQESLLHDMHAVTAPECLWPSNEFFRAKWEEQKSRHAKYADTEYNLEPNVKASPGGLRDIQMIGWIAARHFGERDPKVLARLGLLTEDELSILVRGRDYLWRVRYALHLLAGREDDRLLFDSQRALAEMFGYEDSDRLAIEQFMHQYYRWAQALGQLNEVLMQHFDQVILRADTAELITPINSRFQIRNGYIETRNEEVFSKTPSAMLEIFVLCANNTKIEGVHVSTIRLIRDHRELIDDAFREDPRNRRLFMQLLRSPHKLARQFRRMNRYGVLGKYLPEFGRIVGQMQHDLFHIYTVDAHTLEVVKNMRRFQYPEFRERFPVTSRVAARLPKPELLYIAGLYHDIGKGRGGDHSELGAIDAKVFCKNHGLSDGDTELVCWLIQHHLYMSGVAQRKDISDPEVIQEFATTVGDQNNLDYLFTLTVADINATNPTLWNAWRGSLLRQLYTEAKRALSRGLGTKIDKQQWIEKIQKRALEALEDRGFIADEVMSLWQESGDDYFMREKPEDIVWHTEAIAEHFDKDSPLVLVKPSTTDNNIELATQIFVHARSQDYLFAVVAAALEQLDLSVQDARVYNSVDGMAMDTFYVLDANGETISQDPDRIQHISAQLTELLGDRARYPEIVKRRTPRQVKFFSVPTETSMGIDETRQVSVLEVTTPDRPGLLARIGGIFFDFGIELQAAKIATLGERVEDVFFITDGEGNPITDQKLSVEIQSAICKELDEQAAA
jgi:[protein-PII] uridylyltransferase